LGPSPLAPRTKKHISADTLLLALWRMFSLQRVHRCLLQSAPLLRRHRTPQSSLSKILTVFWALWTCLAKDVAHEPSNRSKMFRHLCEWSEFVEEVGSDMSSQCIVVLCGSQYAGNLGSSIRSCALLGAKWVCVLDVVETKFIKTAFRAAQLERHAGWDVRLVRAPADLSQVEALAQLRDSCGFQLMGLSEGADAVPIWNAELDQQRLAVVFGKETGGIPAEVEASLDTIATVPQVDTGCLNVSHAIAITAYERHRQKQKSQILRSDGQAAKRRREHGPT